MSPYAVIATLLAYFALLLFASRMGAKRGEDFYASRSRDWRIVTLGMITSCMSGVSFVSVPGMVAGSGFGYLQMCIGFFLGYLVIAFVLSPLYFKLGVVSIYQYLDRRFGDSAHMTGACIYFASQLLRASLRIFLLCSTQQLLIFGPLGLPFALNALITIGILVAYTWRGGVRSVVSVDVARTFCMVAAVALTVFFIARNLPGGLTRTVQESGMTQVFFFDDPNDPRYFWKQLFGGLFMVVAMTGLDQDMMQRTLTCRRLADSQKNLVLSSLLQIVVIAGFLLLGVLLYAYAEAAGIPESGDSLFPAVATGGELPAVVGVLFVLGLSAASYGAGGSSLTALTTAATVDVLPKLGGRLRSIHLAIAAAMFLSVLAFRSLSNTYVLDAIYRLAGYTYGPLLGVFAFGILTRRGLRGPLVPLACLSSPLVCAVLSHYSESLFDGYRFGYELLPINAALTFVLLALVSVPGRR